MTTRGTILVQRLVTNAGTISSGGVGTINPTNGAFIALDSQTEGVVLVVQTTGAVGTVTFAPGANPPSFRSGIGGTVSVVVPGTAFRFITFDGSQLIQSDGTVFVDYSAGMAGNVTAYRIPADN